jgi:predicted enzyme related to lactoylglutathione lyase
MESLRRIDHVMLWVSDLERSLAFYEKTLGIPVERRDPRFTTLKMEGAYLALHPGKQEPAIRPEKFGAQVVFRVRDIEATAAELKARGVTFVMPPMQPQPDLPGFWLALFLDPDGYVLQLVQH